jgi:hypothetical protein
MKSFLYILIVCALFFGCKKYPEDGKLSLRTAKNRLTNHNWRLKDLFINGIDSTSRNYYTVSSTFNYKDKIFGLGKGITTYDKNINEITKAETGMPFYGWQFVSGSHKMEIYFASGGSASSNFRADMNSLWEILKLTNNEFILKTQVNGKTIQVRFEKE